MGAERTVMGKLWGIYSSKELEEGHVANQYRNQRIRFHRTISAMET
jgi:hypothetical protein